MTDLSALPARELDARVHAALGHVWDESRCRVCGWRLDPEERLCRLRDDGKPCCSLRPAPHSRRDEPPAYSTDGDAMLGLLREIDSRGWGYRNEREPSRGYDFIQIRAYEPSGYPNLYDAKAPTLPRAVAEAFVLAVEGEAS